MVNELVQSKKKVKSRSLKKNIMLALLLSTVGPIVLIGAISYYIIYTILDHKTVHSVQSTVAQVRSNIEQTYNNLNYVSQQLPINDMQTLFASENPVDRYLISQQIYDYLQLVSFTNPEIGLFLLYLHSSNDVFYQNELLPTGTSPNRTVRLSGQRGIEYHSPHPTLSERGGIVLSVSRPIHLPKQPTVNVFIETDLSVYSRLLNSDQYGMNATHVLTDGTGKIVFSQDKVEFPVGMSLPVDFTSRDYYRIDGYYAFMESSELQGWKVYSMINSGNFQKEIRRWTLSYTIIALSSLLLCLLLGLYIWKMLSYPLAQLLFEIRRLGDSRLDDSAQMNQEIHLTRISEFDVLLSQFKEMRSNILTLMNELKKNEEDKRYLEIEKLVAQINPHFLYNTLNTVQWIARIKGQNDIAGLIKIFIRLLRYNLGKNGGLVKLSMEMEAMRDYIALQQIRYNQEFPIRIDVDLSSLDVPVPRFLLQPLIENAIFHGQSMAGGTIELSAKRHGDDHILVQVKDHGNGMSEEQFHSLLHKDIPEKDKVGMGIGLNYVNSSLIVHYGEEAGLRIDSRPGQGTTIYFHVPIQSKGE